jgi:hypothetical protein
MVLLDKSNYNYRFVFATVSENSGTRGEGFWVAEPGGIPDSVAMRKMARVVTEIQPIFMTFTEMFPHVKGEQKCCHPVTRVTN